MPQHDVSERGTVPAEEASALAQQPTKLWHPRLEQVKVVLHRRRLQRASMVVTDRGGFRWDVGSHIKHEAVEDWVHAAGKLARLVEHRVLQRDFQLVGRVKSCLKHKQ